MATQSNRMHTNRQTQDISQSAPSKLMSNRCRTGINRGWGTASSKSPLNKGTLACNSLVARLLLVLRVVSSRYSVTDGVIVDSRIISLIVDREEVEGPATGDAFETEAINSFSSKRGFWFSDCDTGAVLACFGLELPLECTPGNVSNSTVNGVTGILKVDLAWISISFSILLSLFNSAS